jgi:rare lipoprotein A
MSWLYCVDRASGATKTQWRANSPSLASRVRQLPSIRQISKLQSAALKCGLRSVFVLNTTLNKFMIVSTLVASLCACSAKNARTVDETQTLSPRLIRVGDPVPKGGGVYKVGEPYLANGKWYTPGADINYDEVGLASWYGDYFHGRQTANGEIYDMHALTAAHPTLPLPTYASVTNLANNRTVIVRINDRGPYHSDRIIDLSRRAAELLGFFGHGLAHVRVRYFGPAPLNGDDSLERKTLAKQPWAPRVEPVFSLKPGGPGTAKAAPTIVASALPKNVPTPQPIKTGHKAGEAGLGGWTATTQPLPNGK